MRKFVSFNCQRFDRNAENPYTPAAYSWPSDMPGSAQKELWKELPDPVLDAVAAVVSPEHPKWVGTPTELAQTICMELKPNALSTKLNVNAGRLLREHGVQYWNKRKHNGRQITLMVETRRDDV